MSGDPLAQFGGEPYDGPSSQPAGSPTGHYDPLAQFGGEIVNSSHHAPRIGQLEAFGSSFADTASLGFGDELAGAVEGGVAALNGGNYADVYARRVAAARRRLREAREDRPVSAGLGMLAGGAALGLATGGLGDAATAGRFGAGVADIAASPIFNNPISRAAQGRGWRALGAQSLLGAGGGAVGGAAYGFGEGDGDLNTRLHAAEDMGKAGAGFGFVAPAVFQGVGARSVLQRAPAGAAIGAVGATLLGQDPLQGAMWGAAGGAIGRPLYREGIRPAMRALNSMRFAPEPGTMRTNMTLTPLFGGRRGGGNPPPTPEVSDYVLHRADDILARSRTTASDLEQQLLHQAQRDEHDVLEGRHPLDLTFADMLPEANAEADALANMAGDNYTRAYDIARERHGPLHEHLRTDAESYLGIRQSPSEAMNEIAAEAGKVGEDYNRILREPPRPEGLRQLQELMGTRTMQRALAARYQTEEARASRLALRGEHDPHRSIDLNSDGSYSLRDDASGRDLHLLKGQVDHELNAAADRMSQDYASQVHQGEMDSYRGDFLQAMEKALPGYTDVRNARGDLHLAREALGFNRAGHATMGAQLLRLTPRELRQRMNTTVRNGVAHPTTEFEKRMYRISVLDEVLQRIDDYASASQNKVRNATEVLDRVGLQNRLRAVFDDSDAVEQFLNRAIERGDAARRSAGWIGNSWTARRQARATDQLVATMRQLGAKGAVGDIGGVLGDLGHHGLNLMLGRHDEMRNNAFGQFLFSHVNSNGGRARIEALAKELKRLERERIQRGRYAMREGLIGITGGGIGPQQQQ